MKTVLITGCSSGFGQEAARHFLAQGWKVVATMRTPDAALLPQSEHLRILPLDVADEASIRAAVAAAGPIDVLVNNAGVGLLGAFESQAIGVCREVFETNVLGLMALTQAVLPQMRERRAGVVVNVASTVTLKALPLLAVYTASKAAVVAFTEVLALELAPLGVRARVVLPGMAQSTKFGANAMPRSMVAAPDEYAPMLQQVMAGFQNYSGPVTREAQVAEAIWRAATDEASPLALPAGDDAVAWAATQPARVA
ncbi:SDR family NAD(P)-dependent oxidoreductase [Xylophilus rhododendri]|uniref:SDR family NAD(P)-dependent oxidoreductase n=1 Tax=Xylophilus rhododendri TaxID=2697032 RepID=A0A857J3X3_9BURK|nr:SDR family oxidoreductase [Xylophilus rhododendri]QHI97752.1 SDR family NAD(P)-dependent oxidoreductase [Xylophilus rhododendri]